MRADLAVFIRETGELLIVRQKQGVTALCAASLLILSGCAKHEKPSPVTERPLPPMPTAPPVHSALHAANSNLSGYEAVWHLRAAINVAALSCDRSGKLSIAAGYNRMLARQRGPLAAACRAEQAGFAAAGALNTHVTRIYNLFAQPSSHARFFAIAA